jgi:hypothetical protein
MKLLTFTLMIAFSVLVLAVGTPNLEQSRQEARSAQAFIQAQRIQTGSLPYNTVDPWGMPFRISKNKSDVLVVTSLGANMSTPAAGYDDDDISSAMSFPPHKRLMRRKQTRLLATLILSASPWLLLLTKKVSFVLSHRRHAVGSRNSAELKSL